VNGLSDGSPRKDAFSAELNYRNAFIDGSNTRAQPFGWTRGPRDSGEDKGLPAKVTASGAVTEKSAYREAPARAGDSSFRGDARPPCALGHVGLVTVSGHEPQPGPRLATMA
jgi:hypothetical protein